MEGIRLDKRKFGWFNDCDCHQLFKKQIDRKTESLSENEKLTFNGDTFIESLTDELFEMYEHILVSPENKIYGCWQGKYNELGHTEDAYECAKQII
jgi:hypothetical protein